MAGRIILSLAVILAVSGPALGQSSAAPATAMTPGVDLPAPQVSGDKIQAAIKADVEALYGMMNEKTFWELPGAEAGANAGAGAQRDQLERLQQNYTGGRTALVVLALLYAGDELKGEEAGRREKLKRAIKYLEEIDTEANYNLSLRCSVWSKLHDPQYKRFLGRDARKLMELCKDNGKLVGYFLYMPDLWGDHSNTQYGVLGLRDAAIRGVEIPQEYWEAIQKHMIDTQAVNGGWGYHPLDGHPPAPNLTYGAMTVGGLANLYITLDRLSSGYEGVFSGTAAKGCGQRKQPAAIDFGLAWLDRNLPVDFGLKATGGDEQTYKRHGKPDEYYLYGLERCANASGRKTFGGLNWFQEGAKLLTSQRQVETAYGLACGLAWKLLFLSKGSAPVYYNKLDTKADWNNDLLDIANISNYIGEIGLERRVNWQVVDIKDPVETWLDAPILFFNGHKFPSFTAEQKKKLRLYTDSGGTIVAEACCSMPEFATGFRKMAKEVWPEWEFKAVDRKHPLLTVHNDIKGPLPTMFHMFDGCRDRVFLITQDVSCAWNQNLQDRFPSYFQLGMNLGRYASDRRALRSRLDYQKPVCRELADAGKPMPAAPAVERKLVLVDWPAEGLRLTDVRGPRHLAETLKEAFNIALEVRPAEDQIFDHLEDVNVIHLSGHNTFAVPAERLVKLQTWLRKGGLLWADAQCGRAAFNESFQALAPKLSPGAALAKIAQDDPLITGRGLALPGFDVTSIRYKASLKATEFAPVLEELKVNGRRAVIYSPRDLTCGLDGHDCAFCLGPERNDALKMAANIVLSTLPAEAPAAGAAPAASATPATPEQP